MYKHDLSKINEHPDYNDTIEEIVQKTFDREIMDIALTKTKRESRAEALYVLLKLGVRS